MERIDEIETAIVGVPLSALTAEELYIIGIPRLALFQQNFKNHGEDEYQQRLRALFQRTAKTFDWASVVHKGEDLKTLRTALKHSNEPTQTRDGQLLFSPYVERALLVYELYLKKNLTYKDSWRRRGEVGVFHNLARKWDRLEVLVQILSKGYNIDRSQLAEEEEPFIETLIDLVNYGLMWISILPNEEVEAWARRNGLDRSLARGAAALVNKQINVSFLETIEELKDER